MTATRCALGARTKNPTLPRVRNGSYALDLRFSDHGWCLTIRAVFPGWLFTALHLMSPSKDFFWGGDQVGIGVSSI